MTIQAIALLRVSKEALPEAARARATSLEDGVLLSTDASFADDPEELSVVVRALAGPAVESEHRDPRGILFIPSVVSPSATRYEDVVEEIGEGGVWGPLVDALDLPVGDEGFQALLGNLLGQLPSSLLAAANAAAQGQPGAFEAMGAQLQGMLGNSDGLKGLFGPQGEAGANPMLQALATAALGEASLAEADAASDMDDEDLSVGQHATDHASDADTAVQTDHESHIGDMAQLAALLGGAGFQLDSPQLQQLARTVRSELERDPSAAVRLAEQLMGEYGDQEGSERDK
jgi:hypothetical protein